MKNGYVKSIIKGALSIGMATMMIMPQSVYAKTRVSSVKNPTKVADERTKEMIEKFPGFEKTWNTDIEGLASSDEKYYKFIPKETVLSNQQKTRTIKTYKDMDDAQKDFIIKEYTPQEYQNEKLKTYSPMTYTAKSIGNQQGGTCSWLRISLQVYNSTKSGSNYLAYNYSSWLKDPACRFQDAIGISMSSGLILSGDDSTRQAQYIYTSPMGEQYDEYHNLYIHRGEKGNGVMATFQLHDASHEYSDGGASNRSYHDAMIGTGIKYSNANIKSGWITGQYSHKQLSFGSYSISSSGSISVSPTSVVTDNCPNAAIYVER